MDYDEIYSANENIEANSQDNAVLGLLEVNIDGIVVRKEAGKACFPEEVPFLADELLAVVRDFKKTYGAAAAEYELHNCPQVVSAIVKSEKKKELEEIFALN